MENAHTNFHLHFEASWSKQGFINKIKTVGHPCTRGTQHIGSLTSTLAHVHYTTLHYQLLFHIVTNKTFVQLPHNFTAAVITKHEI